MKIGYARVSTREQAASLDTQRAALQAAGCERVFEDTVSGARSDRPGMTAARSHLREGDTLVVTRLVRLGRSRRDTVAAVAKLTDEGVGLVLLDLGVDSATREGRLMIHILSALAQQELETIQARTRAGLDHARANGRMGGRKPKLNARQREAALAALRGGLTIKDVAAMHGVSRWTITRLRDAAAEAD